MNIFLPYKVGKPNPMKGATTMEKSKYEENARKIIDLVDGISGRRFSTLLPPAFPKKRSR